MPGGDDGGDVGGEVGGDVGGRVGGVVCTPVGVGVGWPGDELAPGLGELVAGGGPPFPGLVGEVTGGVLPPPPPPHALAVSASAIIPI